MGAATTRALARRGSRVIALEQFRVGHSRGSSHGRSRIFRLSYPEAHYVDMAQQALPLWRALESELERTLLTTTGGIDVGAGVRAHARALEDAGASFEVLDAATAGRRWPFLALPRAAPVLFQPDAGFVAADEAVAALVASARAAGAVVREGSRVERVDVGDSAVTISLDGELLRSPTVVITAGAWVGKVAKGLEIDLPVRVTRESVSYFRLEGAVPPTVVEWEEPVVYALWSPGQGIKVGEHAAGPVTDPDEPGPPDADSVTRTREWVASRFPTADARPLLSETCLYTNEPNERFILERRGRVVVGSPCSGHGFKFAPLIGERLADLALEG
jgi:sarcosine oxidase